MMVFIRPAVGRVRVLAKRAFALSVLAAGVFTIPLIVSQRTFHIGEYPVNLGDLELTGGIVHADAPTSVGGEGGGGGEGGDGGGGGEGGDGGGDGCP